jgi:hypothetical protein
LQGELDTDGDGIPDWYEVRYTGSATGLVAHVDGDGDGPDHYAEWIANTDPTNGASFFHVSEAGRTPSGDPILQWTSVYTRVYNVGWSNRLDAGLAPLATNLAATPPVNTYTDTTHAVESTGFYGVEVQRAP